MDAVYRKSHETRNPQRGDRFVDGPGSGGASRSYLDASARFELPRSQPRRGTSPARKPSRHTVSPLRRWATTPRGALFHHALAAHARAGS